MSGGSSSPAIRDFADSDADAVNRLAVAAFAPFATHYSDWTAMAANENCNNWTNDTNNYQMMQGQPGQTTRGFLRQSQDFTYGCSDQGFMRPVYCVEP